jgi:Mg2+/Co2+ transporter CorC
VIKGDIPFLALNDHLRTALNQQELSGDVVIPVVNNKEDMMFEGVLYAHDLLLCYQREIQRARAAERGDPLPPTVYQ